MCRWSPPRDQWEISERSARIRVVGLQPPHLLSVIDTLRLSLSLTVISWQHFHFSLIWNDNYIRNCRISNLVFHWPGDNLLSSHLKLSWNWKKHWETLNSPLKKHQKALLISPENYKLVFTKYKFPLLKRILCAKAKATFNIKCCIIWILAASFILNVEWVSARSNVNVSSVCSRHYFDLTWQSWHQSEGSLSSNNKLLSYRQSQARNSNLGEDTRYPRRCLLKSD